MTNQHIPHIRLSDYSYTLPETSIAQEPVSPRDHARLLLYDAGDIRHHHFFELPQLLKAGDELVFNNTKVIPARLLFEKSTGALIEILLLSPHPSTTPIDVAMTSQGSCTWQCMIRNKKRWKEQLQQNFQTETEKGTLFAKLEDSSQNLIHFHWQPAHLSFSQVLHALGKLPLPPYIQRQATLADTERYQTIYAKQEGAIAAPTAGLHFTQSVLDALQQQGVGCSEVTLHVSAGTFQPVQTPDDAFAHAMHEEQIFVHQHTIEKLLQSKGRIIAVGTTSMRTLETLYWLGVHVALGKPLPTNEFYLNKYFAYQHAACKLSYHESLDYLLAHMSKQCTTQLVGNTQIYIVPGYRFRVCKGLITNFHMPATTLILLVAAFIGNDWRKVYQTAFEQGYRFLSYGDSSLLIPQQID